MPEIDRRSLLTGALGGLSARQATGAAKPPNILHIMTDQQQWATIAGRSECRTPNLNRLAESGHAVRALVYAVGGVLSRAGHDPLGRLSLAQRSLQPDPLAAVGTSRHECRTSCCTRTACAMRVIGWAMSGSGTRRRCGRRSISGFTKLLT